MSKKKPYSDLAAWNPNLWVNDDGSASQETLQTAALFAIRDELQRLNCLLHCSNFQDIPHKLERIKRNTTKKRKRVVKAKPKLRVVR